MTGIVDDGVIHVAVEDSGGGFSDDVLSRAFDPFVRGQAGDDGDREGSGLGLAIVRVIAEAHGGNVETENLPSDEARVSLVVRNLS